MCLLHLERTTLNNRLDLFQECFDLLQMQWKEQPSIRRRSLMDGTCRNSTRSHLLLIQTDTTLSPKVVAHGCLRPGPDSHTAILASVIVHPFYRRKGIGRQLMEYAEDYSKAKNVPLLYLWTKDQVGFYKRLGYVTCTSISKLQTNSKSTSLNEFELHAIENILRKKIAISEPIENVYNTECIWLRKRLIDEFPLISIPIETSLKGIQLQLRYSHGDVPNRFHILSTPWTRQIGPSCGIAALRMVLSFWKSNKVNHFHTTSFKETTETQSLIHNVSTSSPFLSSTTSSFLSSTTSSFLSSTSSLSVPQEQVTLLQYALENGLSAEGELFAANYLVKLARNYSGMTGVEIQGFNANVVIQLLIRGIPLLIAYDRDENHLPCLRKGKSAHWCMIKGFGVDEKWSHDSSTSPFLASTLDHHYKFDSKSGQWSQESSKFTFRYKEEDLLYLIISQGLSENDILVSYSELYHSNQQLDQEPSFWEKQQKWKIPDTGIELSSRLVAIVPESHSLDFLGNQSLVETLS